MFRCSNSQKPHMDDKKSRIRTFSKSWYDQESPKQHKLADADFYNMGSGDGVNCFYCEGQLFNWRLRGNSC